MGKNKRRASLTIVLLFIFNLLFTNSIRVYSATDNTLGGRGAADPLKIVVNEQGSLELYYWQLTPQSNFTTYGYVNQYFANNAWGTNVFFTSNGSQKHFVTPYYSEWDSNPQQFGQGVQSRNGNTITTVWSLGNGELSLKQQITYTPGAAYYEKKWSLTNTSDSTYSNLKLIHGGDTYFGGDDSAMSYYSPVTGMVYVRNSDMTKFGLMGFTGSSSTPANRYFSGNYSTGGMEAISGNLSNTFNSSYQDAGYQLQWNNNSLTHGETWTIVSNERLTPPGVLQSLAPAEKTARPGYSVTYEFIVHNFESSANDYKLEASSSNGWNTTIQEGSTVNILGNGAAKIIHVTVNIPEDAIDVASDVVTLKSEKISNPTIKSETSTATTIEVITGVTPEVNRILPTRRNLKVEVNTVHVDEGTPVTVSLLDAARNPLSPAVVTTGVVGENNTTTIPLQLPGNLKPGEIYTIQVAVQGVAGVNTSATISIDKVPYINAVISGSDELYVSNTKINKDVILSSTDSGLQYTTNNGGIWTNFVNPMTVSSSGEYTFRFIGETDSQKYTHLSVDINKVFQGTVSGIENNHVYTDKVSPVITGDNVVTLSKDGGPETNYTSGTEILEDGKYILKAVDSYGNEVVYNFTIDKTSPTLEVTGNPSEWTNSNVVLDIASTTGVSGVSNLTVSKDGENPIDIKGNTNYTVSANGTYTFTLTNGAGVSVTKTVEVNKIDKTIPELVVKDILVSDKVYNYSSSVPAEDDVVIKLGNSNDVLSGTKYYYTTDGTTWNEIDGDTLTISDTNSETVNYRFKSVSNSGVESQVSNPIPVYISKPTYTDDIKVGGNVTDGKWSNKDVTITLEGGINSESFLKYQYSTDPENEDSWTDMEGENHNTLLISSDTNDKYYFRVVSKGGSTGSVTEGVDVKVDKTAATDLTISFDNNTFKEFINKITFGLFFNESVDVNISAEDELSGIDYYEYQLVDINNGESYDENGTWTKLTNLSVDPEFKGAVYARAVDKAGNVSSVISTNGFIVENQQASSISLDAKTLDSTYNGNWTGDDIVVTLADGNTLAGIDRYEYKIGETGEWVTMPETTGAKDEVTGNELKNKITISNNVNSTYYFRAVSNSGLYSNESSLLVRHDNETPVIKSETNIVDGWTNKPVTFTFDNTNSGTLSPVTYYIKIGSGEWTPIQGNSYTFSNDVNTTAQFKVVNSSGLEDVLDTVYNIKIDKTIPVIKGADNKESYYIGRVINYEDAFGEIEKATYQKNDGSEVNLANGALINEAGEYSIKVKDKSGNESTISFTVKALPLVSDVIYSEEYKEFISDIRKEFSSHDDLPEPYKTNTDNAIKALEDRYAALDKEVKDTIQDKNEIENTVDSLPGKTDGLISMKDKINEVYNRTISDTLTPEQKEALKSESDYLKGLLDAIDALEKNISDVKVTVNSIPKSDDGLIAQKDNILEALEEINKLTDEQKEILKDQIAELNELLGKIKVLEEQVSTNKEAVNSIPKSDDGLIAQKALVQNRLDETNKLTDEQKELLKDQIAELNELLGKIKVLEEQVSTNKEAVNRIPKSDDGLIAQKTLVQNRLDEINKLTKEQQELLVKEIQELKDILGRIETLENEVDKVNNAIDSLPSPSNVKKSDLESVNNAYELYSNLNKEQKSLVKDTLVNKLADLRDRLSKLLLHDSPTGVTITGIDGTVFDEDAYIVVDPINDETNTEKITFAKDSVKEASKSNEVLKGKELLTLYDISIFKGKVKIQPNGKVQVRVEIPEDYLDKEGLDIIYISDDGKVVSMNAERDGKYLTFITDHFSMYGIVANEEKNDNLPKTGGMNQSYLIALGALIIATGAILVKRRKKEASSK
ncbi:LPXTG cell wall anchor domain-containing protein [Clostridium sp. YIM B02506]|uniref:LPXTG cell wall anchor domain-containing protein n=1 Tax=Clostridium sp. YIM B02506 TaxID=2910680 RepID=UPI001EEF3BFD|nr:LPXTG cell wall anchor domain-containing protein [Clostridium sp. YIM B02506]